MTATARKLPLEQAPAKALRWDPRKWGTLADPIHKSQIGTLIGEFSCTKQFRFDRLRELAGDERETCSGKTEMGTAGHAAIERALKKTDTREKILAGAFDATPAQVRNVIAEEFAWATQDRRVVWYGKAEHDDTLDDITQMVHGVLSDLHKHVRAVILTEAGFIAPFAGYWIEGHVDLIYEPQGAPDALALTDWKTGAVKPDQIVLDHGYESGLYSAALKHGLFLPTDALEWMRARVAEDDFGALPTLANYELIALKHARSHREAMHIALRALARSHQEGNKLPDFVRVFGRYPDQVRLTHLPDYELYQKKGKKKVERPEELAHWGLTEPGEINYVAGQRKGPAWYRVRRTEHDLPRLENLLRGIVGWVRMGKFVESVGEKCKRCSYRGPCLTEGYELRGEDAKELNAALRGIANDVGAIDLND